MKTTIEDFNDIDSYFTDNADMDDCRDYLKRRIAEIKLDAWRQGMTDAAHIAGTVEQSTLKARRVAEAILTVRDNKKEI